MKTVALMVVLACAGVGGRAQSPLWSDAKPASPRAEAVKYLYPEQVTLPTGKAGTVELHFRVAPGLHINSHDPRDAFLIPTTFSIPADAGVRLESVDYPPGTDFVLPADPNTRLNVFTGEFALRARMVAAPGDHLIAAKLRYQACDEAQCMPPKTIAVTIDVVGK